MQPLWKFILTGSVGLAVLPFGCNAQDAHNTSASDSIRKYEILVEQPVAANSGAVWWKLALLYQDAARFNEAERAYTNAIRLLKAQKPDAVADVTDCMGTMYVQAGQLSKAERLERDALTVREINKDLPGVGISWTHLSTLSLNQRHVSDAAMYAQWAVDRLLTVGNDDGKQKIATPEQKMSALVALSLARCEQGMCEDALAALQRARDIADSSYQTRSFPISYIDFLTGYAHWKTGNAELAAELMRRGTAGMQADLGWGHPTYLAAMKQYALFLKQTQRREEASEVKRIISQSQKSHQQAGVTGGLFSSQKTQMHNGSDCSRWFK
jgi:tetratricopeptide (TPR) repeat protein